MIGAISKEILTINSAMLEGSEMNPLRQKPLDELFDIGQNKENDQSPVKLNISQESQLLLNQTEGEFLPAAQLQDNLSDYSSLTGKKEKQSKSSKSSVKSDKESASGEEVTEDEERMLDELRQRDTEVRTHEQQHAAAAGPYLRGGPYYEYQTGPDGRMYAIGGHVDLDVSEEDTPEATIRKAQSIRQAATAPGEPSSADQAIARSAASMEQEARSEQLEESKENGSVDGEKDKNKSPLSFNSEKLQKAYDVYEGIPQTGVILNLMG